MIQLTPEQTDEAIRSPEGVECLGSGTNKTFILMDAELVRKMQAALYHKDVVDSVKEGMADVESGRVMSLGESQAYVRDQCGLTTQ